MNTETTKTRVAWIDYSKGICIAAVVGLYATMIVSEQGRSTGWMQYWVDFARPFRMPDFFLIAGLFLSRTIDSPWRQYIDKKVVHFFYFFALWTTIYFALSQIKHPGDGLGEYLWLYVEPFHMLWFIEMLPAYFLATRLVRRIPWFVVLPAAAALQIVEVDTAFGMVDKFCERYVYFYAGYAFAPLIFRFADWAGQNLWRSVALLIAWAVAEETLVLAGVSASPGIGLALGFIGAGAVVVAGVLLSRTRGMDWLRYLGQNSIVVFLAFFIFTMPTLIFFNRYPIIADVGTQELLATATGVLGPVLMFRLVRNTPARFLFVRPQWFRLPTGVPSRVAASADWLVTGSRYALLGSFRRRAWAYSTVAIVLGSVGLSGAPLDLPWSPAGSSSMEMHQGASLPGALEDGAKSPNTATHGSAPLADGIIGETSSEGVPALLRRAWRSLRHEVLCSVEEPDTQGARHQG